MIKFGTDGWRDVIAENYTFANVALVSRAAAEYFKNLDNIDKGIAIGYDARFLSREFAVHAARVIASQGIKVHLATSIVSTPAASLAIIKNKLAAGVMITASHNPAKYNGYKIKGWYGGAALPDAVSKIEAYCLQFETPASFPTYEELKTERKIVDLDARKLYLATLKKLVNFDRIKRAKIRIAYDPMYGSGIDTLEHLLPNAAILHNVWNPSFGGTPPEPLAHNTKEFANFVVEGGYDLGIVTDGDADRIAAIDENGNFFSSQMILCLLLKYLVEARKKKGDVAVSLSVTSMIDRMCEKYGIKVIRTPVGFKHITKHMLEGNILIGGEESGGIGIPSIHIPERDGLFNGLLLAEICAYYKKSLGELVADLEQEFGAHKYDRFDFHTTDERKAMVLGKARNGFTEVAGLKVQRVDTTDGFKWLLDGGAWLMIRTSGTEPLLRYYAEAKNQKTVKTLLDFAKRL